MEKNNKKIITSMVIGIITLIVLVGGATYAYFEASNTASGTTTLEATTQELPVATVNVVTENLYLRLTANEMQENKKGTPYWAENVDSDNGPVYSDEIKLHEIAKLSITSTNSAPGYFLACNFDLNITKPNDIQAGDMGILLGDQYLLSDSREFRIDGMTSSFVYEEDEKGNSYVIDGGVDLYSASSKYNVYYEFGSLENNSISVYGGIKLNNTDGVQDHLIGKTLTASISVSDLNCTIMQK